MKFGKSLNTHSDFVELTSLIELELRQHISTQDLEIADKVRIGWLPNRICIVRYLGDNKFIAEQCKNSTMKEGNTFTCHQFILGKELVMSDFRQNDNDNGKIYVVGKEHGITTLNLEL